MLTADVHGLDVPFDDDDDVGEGGVLDQGLGVDVAHRRRCRPR
jgi:hypothetical protein